MSISSNVQGPGGVYEANSSSEAPPPNASTQSQGNESTLERSDRERSASEMIATMMALSNPWIIPSDFASFLNSAGNSSSLSGIVALSQLAINDQIAYCHEAALRLSELATKMGNKWVESVQEVAEAAKKKRQEQSIEEEQIKFERAREEIKIEQIKASEILIASISPAVISLNREIDHFIQDKFQRNGSIDPGSDLLKVSSVVVGLSLAAGAGYQLMPSSGIQGTLINAITPIQDASNQLAAYIFSNPQEIASAVLTINLLVVPAEIMARAVAIKEGKGEKEAMDLANARWLASKLIEDVIGNPLFASIAKALYASTLPEGEQVDPEKLNSYLIKMTAMALLDALLLLYKAEYGGVSGQELASLLKGEMEIPDQDIMAKIRNFLMGDEKMGTRGLLFELPQDERAAFLEKLLAYADTDPSFEKLKKPLVNLHEQLFALLPTQPEVTMI